MKHSATPLFSILPIIVPTIVVLSCAPAFLNAATPNRPVRNKQVLNNYGFPVIDAKGQHIRYDRGALEAMAHEQHLVHRTKGSPRTAPATKRTGFVPEGGQTQQPFWQYAIFGSGVGGSNIVVGPTPPNGPPEIILGGNSTSDFGGDDFWQVIRYNSAGTSYETIFVSPLYSSDHSISIARLGLAHVTDASAQQIVVELDSGRIYLYDFATKAELGYFDTAVSGLEGLSLTDLDGDGFAEVIVTTMDDLFVFNGSGQLLWQVAGAGGSDVVAGTMDNGASLKIAATNGKVVDAVTHAVVWNYANGFGIRLRLALFPGENYQQLISASAWQFVYSYDVGRQLPRWSIETPQDIGAIEVADVDNDGIPEVIIGDGQWGTVHVHDLLTQALKWE